MEFTAQLIQVLGLLVFLVGATMVSVRLINSAVAEKTILNYSVPTERFKNTISFVVEHSASPELVTAASSFSPSSNPATSCGIRSRT